MAVLIATLRPAGDTGDGNDASYVERLGFVNGFVRVPATALALGDLAAAPDGIEFVRFYMRSCSFPVGFGPQDPQVWVQWRVGTGTFIDGDAALPPSGVGVFTTIEGWFGGVQDIATNPSGGPWTLADVNALQMRGTFFLNDGGSGESTTCQVADFWAEVYAPDPPPPTSPHETERITLASDGDESATLAGEGDFALTLECGSNETLACEGDLSITLQCDVDEEV